MADYSINAVTRRIVFSGSAGTGPYAFTFEVLDQTDIAVYFNAVKLTLTTDYTVAVASNGTGSVTIVTGTNVPSTPVTADQITIVGARAISRTTDFVTAGDLRASALNEQLDGQIVMAQQISEENKRAVRAPVYDPALAEDGGVVNMELPTKASRANNYLAFDANGNPSVGVEVGVWRGNWAATVAFALRDIVKDTTNSNIYIAITAHTSSGSLPISTNADAAKWALVVDAAAAATSATAAAASATSATASATSATASKTAAAASETAAASSQTAAATSASGAATSATNAASDAAAAGTSETNAGNSATAAASSQTAAASSATAAASSQTAAASSASGAATSATNAGTSETNAATSASAASTSASGASTSASGASTSASGASTSATSAGSSATAAAASATAAAASYDSFDDRYLGAKSSAPSVDNDGGALITGALYFDTTAGDMMVWNGSAWVATGSTISSVYQRFEYTASGSETSESGADDNGNTLEYDAGFIMVFLNGVMLNDGDYTATTGSSITGLAALTAGDKLEIIAHGAASPGDYYTKSAADAKYALTAASYTKAAGDAKYALLGANTDITSLSLSSGLSTNTITEKTSASGVTVDGLLIKDGAIPSINVMGKNLIQNGAFRVAQRGTSFTGLGDASANPYTMDRWFFAEESDGGGRYTVAQESGAGPGNGFTNQLSVHCTTADGTLAAGILNLLEQRIEAQNLQHIMKGTAAAKPLTMSFWVKSSQTGVMNVLIRADDNSDRSYLHNYTINVADTWEYKSFTIPGDTTGVINNDNGRGLIVHFVLAAGSTFQGGTADAWATHNNNRYGTDQTVNVFASTDDDWSVTGVQLEVGSVATDFEHEDYGTTLDKCRRYARGLSSIANGDVAIGVGYAGSSTAGQINLNLNPQMRVAPTALTISAASDFGVPEFGVATRVLTALVLDAGSTQDVGALAWTVSSSGLAAGEFVDLRPVTSNATFLLSAEL